MGGYYVGEWTYFVALSIYAFEVGGAAALGALGLARMIPAAIALPFGSLLTDRYSRQRVLLGIHAGRALLFGAIAVALAAESSRTVIFALAALAAVAGAPERPATLSLVPTLARTPRELVATNVSSSTLEGLGTLVGPVLGGVLAATAGVDVAVAVAAAVSALCAASSRESVVRVRSEVRAVASSATWCTSCWQACTRSPATLTPD